MNLADRSINQEGELLNVSPSEHKTECLLLNEMKDNEQLKVVITRVEYDFESDIQPKTGVVVRNSTDQLVVNYLGEILLNNVVIQTIDQTNFTWRNIFKLSKLATGITISISENYTDWIDVYTMPGCEQAGVLVDGNGGCSIIEVDFV
jgi:hypothetical protein